MLKKEGTFTRKRFLNRRTTVLMAMLLLLSAGVVGTFLWLNNLGTAEASSTVTVQLTEQTGTVPSGGSKIDEIGRSGKSWWTFNFSSYPSGTPSSAFCLNPTKHMGSGDKLTYQTYNAANYSNQAQARALTYYYKTLGGGSYSSTVGSNRTKYAIQAYLWAASESGKSTYNAVWQALMNTGLSESTSKTAATGICNAISATDPEGTIYYYTISSCVSSRSASDHQHLLGYTTGTITKVKTNSTYAYGSETPTEVIKISISKEDADDGELITEAEAKFKIKYRGYDVASAASSLSDVTDIKFSVTKGTRSGSTFTTTGGEIEVTITVYFKTVSATSATYNYVENWSELSLSQQTQYANNGYYDSEAKAQKAADTEYETLIAAAKSKYTNTSNKWTVTETSAPTGYVLAEVTTQTKYEGTGTAEKSLTYEFENERGYGGVELYKVADTSTSQYSTASATLKSATYTVYAAEDIPGFKSKDAVVTSFKTNASGYGSSGQVLPMGYSYYLVETEPSNGFYLAGGTYNFKITSDGQVVTVPTGNIVTIEPYLYAYVDLYKVIENYSDDGTLGTKWEKGAKFEIYNTSTGKVVTTLTTNSNGYAKSSVALPKGNYKLVQTAGGGTWIDDVPFTVDYKTVAANGGNGCTIHLSTKADPFVNTLRYGRIVIYKNYQEYIEATGEIVTHPEKTAEFQIQTYYVDDNGKTQTVVWDTIKLTQTVTVEDGTEGGTEYAYGASTVNLPEGIEFTIVQTAGEQDVVWTTDQTWTFSYEKNGENMFEEKTFTLTNTVNFPFVQVNKTKSEKDSVGNLPVLRSGNTGSETSTTSPTPEAGAVFTVVTATYDAATDSYTVPNPEKYHNGSDTLSLSELNSMSLESRKHWAQTLADYDTANGTEIVMATLTTNDNGYALARLGSRTDQSTEGWYVIVQTGGLFGYSVADAEGFYASAGTIETFTFGYTNVKYQTTVSVEKDMTYMLKDGSEYTTEVEPGAVFYVIDADAIGQNADALADEINGMSEEERVEYLDYLSSWMNGDSIVATLITGSDGKASATIDCWQSTKNYVLVQYSGTKNYILADAEAFTYEYQETSEDETETEDTMNFSYVIVNEVDQNSVSVTKKKENILGADEGGR